MAGAKVIGRGLATASGTAGAKNVGGGTASCAKPGSAAASGMRGAKARVNPLTRDASSSAKHGSTAASGMGNANAASSASSAATSGTADAPDAGRGSPSGARHGGHESAAASGMTQMLSEVREWLALQQAEQDVVMRQAADSFAAFVASTDGVLAGLDRCSSGGGLRSSRPHFATPLGWPGSVQARDASPLPPRAAAFPGNYPAIERAVAARRRREAAGASERGGCASECGGCASGEGDGAGRDDCGGRDGGWAASDRDEARSDAPLDAEQRAAALAALQRAVTRATFIALARPTRVSAAARRHHLVSELRRWRQAPPPAAHPLAAVHLAKRATARALRTSLRGWHGLTEDEASARLQTSLRLRRATLVRSILAFTRYCFTSKLLVWESIILLLPPTHAKPCNTIARPMRNIRPPIDPPFLCHTPYNIGDGNLV